MRLRLHAHELHAYGWRPQADGTYAHLDPALHGHRILISYIEGSRGRVVTKWVHYDGAWQGAGHGVQSLQYHLMRENVRHDIGVPAKSFVYGARW